VTWGSNFALSITLFLQSYEFYRDFIRQFGNYSYICGRKTLKTIKTRCLWDDTAKWLQEAINNVPADMKKQYNYSYELSDRIVEQMEAKGISKQELAKLTGKKPSQVTLWLSGQHNFTLATIAKISVALNHDFLKIV
jgi:ribosome-binding protein aMBF1 (putative translation factor)